MPTGKWLKAGQNRTEAKGKSKWRSFEEGGRTAWAFRRQFHSNKQQSHVSENYKGKNPMSRSQWRRHQRNKKAQREFTNKEVGESSTNQTLIVPAMEKKSPTRRKLFSPTKMKVPGEGDNNELASNGLVDDEDMSTDSFNSDGESSLQINCNVVSVLPHEYDQVTEVEDSEEADELEMTKHKLNVTMS